MPACRVRLGGRSVDLRGWQGGVDIQDGKDADKRHGPAYSESCDIDGSENGAARQARKTVP